MRHLWSKRRLAALGALAVAVGVTLWVVLPALGASTNSYYGATSLTQNVTPTFLLTGGQSNDCALIKANTTGVVGTDQYLVSNPKSINGKPQTVTASDGVTVTFTVNVDKSYTYLDFSVTNAIVTDVAIKGGNGTDWYSYEGKPGGGVTSDTGLTAPAQSVAGQPPYSNLSQTVFCYTPKISCQAGVPFGDPSVPGYTIELPSCSGKAGVYYDFSTSTTADGQTVFSVHTENSTTTKTPMVENLTGTLGSSSQTTLRYTDKYPFSDSNLHNMRYCQVDPRAGGSDPQKLASAYQSEASSTLVLQPADATIDPESTSCLIAMNTSVDTSGVVHFQAYVYSLVDGQRVF
jgi:hypothetical protein